MSPSQHTENAIQLLRTQFLETPHLLLTPGEAAERTELDRTTAMAALQALEDSGFLVLTSDGCFALADDGRPEFSGDPSMH